MAGLLWRCRRGMKELDLLLERFAREGYPSAPPELRSAFERLLDLPDPALVELLLDGQALSDAGAPVRRPDRTVDAKVGEASETCSSPGAAAGSPGAGDCNPPAGDCNPPAGGDTDLERVAALVAASGRR